MYSQTSTRLISWQAKVYHATVRLRRPKVTAILCQGCGKWVKARRWNPKLCICHKCVRGWAHSDYAARRNYALHGQTIADHTATGQADRRAYDKQMRQWRRHAAHVTNAG